MLPVDSHRCSSPLLHRLQEAEAVVFMYRSLRLDASRKL